jgi:hypothetical protein
VLFSQKSHYFTLSAKTKIDVYKQKEKQFYDFFQQVSVLILHSVDISTFRQGEFENIFIPEQAGPTAEHRDL